MDETGDGACDKGDGGDGAGGEAARECGQERDREEASDREYGIRPAD